MYMPYIIFKEDNEYFIIDGVFFTKIMLSDINTNTIKTRGMKSAYIKTIPSYVLREVITKNTELCVFYIKDLASLTCYSNKSISDNKLVTSIMFNNQMNGSLVNVSINH